MSATPWDGLLPSASRTSPLVQSGTKVAVLLNALHKFGESTTTHLCHYSGFSSRQVWGLLARPREVGQVRYEDGMWSLVTGFAGADVERAAALLRSKGWRVEAPFSPVRREAA